MIKRDLYLEKITPYIDQPLIKVLVGIRRAGKSTILDQIRDILLNRGVKPEKIIHINFEHLKYLGVRSEQDFIELVQGIVAGGGKHYLLFDEIQNVDGWDRVVNGLLAEGNADIYITGSNSRLLSSELSTHLTGRYVNIHVCPLNFAEFLDFRRARGENIGELDTEFSNFMDRGGFPAIHIADYTLDQGDDIVSDIYSATIFRDLVERKGIRNTDLLARVVKFVFDNIGNIFSAKTITDYLKSEKRRLDPETIYNYLDWLEEVFVIARVPRYDLRGKATLKTNEKYFVGDVGLLYAVNGRQLSYRSGVLENIVFNELLSRGYDVKIGKNGNQEIDFVAEKDGRRLYLQVAVELGSPETIEREFRAFRGIDDNYPKYVLSLDRQWGENREGIEQRYLPEFLLESM
jgi:predicted AAA+ superfamily ATPase